MANTDKRPDNGDERRSHVEEIAALLHADPETLTTQDSQRMVRDMQVYQNELEMQNEELRRAQVQLEASQARYIDLYDLAPVGYVTVSAEGVILEANLTAATLLGVVRSDLIRQPISCFILPEDQDVYYLHSKQLFETSEPQTCELGMAPRSGPTLWIRMEATLSKDADGASVGRIVISDITERKHSEEALRESRESLAGLFEHAVLGLYRTGIDGRPLMGNQALCKLLGFASFEDLVRHDELMQGGDLATNATYSRSRFLREIGKLDRIVGLESLWTKPNGETVTLRESARAVRDASGKLKYFEGIFEDITEWKRMEEALRESEALSRHLQKAESLGRMAGAIAHHFNNKLQSIMANLELLSELPKGVDTTRCITMAMRAAEKAAEVSRLMLLYLGQTTSRREPRFLSELCSHILPLVQGALPDNAVLKTNWIEPGPVISANESEIQRVLINLVSNSWEAMGDSGDCIQISVKLAVAEDIPTAHRYPAGWQALISDYACLEVRDTGCGIADAEIEKLFDPFYSTKFISRGLGLPVVLGIVNAHDGVVTVESEKGEYCVFRLYFPISSEVPRLSETGVQASVPDGGGTILLIDDDELLLMSTGALIEMLGFTLLTARDGVEAVQVFREYRGEIRCVITDLTMPRMDGWETLTALRQVDPSLPIILASGYDKAQVLSGAHPDRPQAFLSKPFGLQQLRDALGQALAVGERL